MVSIITPTFNRENSILGTIQSVLNQSCRNWELIIVDDGSTDGTDKLVKSYKDIRIKYFCRPESRRKGANACRNIGIENANGEWILFLDSDDELPTNFIEDRFQNLSDDFDCVIYPKKREGLFFETKDIVESNPKIKKDIVRFFLGFQFIFRITDTCWSKKYIEKIKFDEMLDRFQDVDVHIRLFNDSASRIKFVKSEVQFIRNKDHDKYEDVSFIKRVINSYLYLNKKYFLSNYFGKRDLGRSSFFLVKKMFELYQLNSNEFATLNNKVLREIHYSFSKTIIFRFTLSLSCNRYFGQNILLKKFLYIINRTGI